MLPGAEIGVDSFVKVCDTEVFDEVVTNWKCVEEQVAALEEKGVTVTIVEEVK